MLPILHQSYWRDEAFSVLLSSKNLKDIFWLTIYKDIHPPLYYFLLHWWIRLFGDAEYVTRSLSLFFHFLLVISCFFLLKHLLKNWKLSLMGALAILLNPFLLEYAFETRAYMLFAFFTVTATLFYLKKSYFISSLFLALMLLTHNFSVFFLIAFIAFWFFKFNDEEGLKKKVINFASLFALPLITLFIWLSFLWNQWVKVAEGFWIGPKTSSIFVDAFRAFFQGSLDYPSKAMLYNLTLVLVFMAFSYWLVRFIENKSFPKRGSLLLIFLFSIPFLMVYIISAFWVPIYHERYLIPVLPVFIVWIIYSLYKLSQLNLSLSYFVFAVSLAYILFSLQSSEEILRKTTKPAINYGVSQVLTQANPGDVIIPESNLNFLEIKYYVKKSGKHIPVFAYSPDKKIVFYLGPFLFEDQEIISEYPQDKRVWIIKQDGGHYLKSY